MYFFVLFTQIIGFIKKKINFGYNKYFLLCFSFVNLKPKNRHLRGRNWKTLKKKRWIIEVKK